MFDCSCRAVLNAVGSMRKLAMEEDIRNTTFLMLQQAKDDVEADTERQQGRRRHYYHHDEDEGKQALLTPTAVQILFRQKKGKGNIHSTAEVE